MSDMDDTEMWKAMREESRIRRSKTGNQGNKPSKIAALTSSRKTKARI